MYTTFKDFMQASITNGAFYAIRKSRDFDKEFNILSFSESELNDLGYRFMNELDRIDDAIEIFKFNTTLFPESSNAFDSLGEAYFLKGDQIAAIDNYRKSLDLNPENKNARYMLRQIRYSQ